MGDRGPEMKTEEQFPLLKVDGGGDTPAETALPPGWGVQCSRKCSWLSRWPECMSTCWMTLVLLVVSALVVFALSMGAYRHQQFVFMRCNNSAPASNVFYHQLVPRGAQIPFLKYSEYLADMASQYRRLQFNVLFLIDDSYTPHISRSSRFLNKLIPYYSYGAFNHYKSDDPGVQALAEFQRRFHNVNVTIMPLTKYMASTNLRYKWKTIPIIYLPFYLRVNSVWENGGISLDLTYHSMVEDSPTILRKNAILKQHNDGIVPEAYANALSKIEEDDTALFTLFFGLVNRFLNETRSFLNRTLTANPLPLPESEMLIRTHRSKREADFNFTTKTTTTTLPADEVVNVTDVDVDNTLQNKSNPLELIKSPFYMLSKALENTGNVCNDSDNKTDTAVVVVYDFHVVSDGMGPQYFVSDIATSGGAKGERKEARRSGHFLSLDPDGSFVAASSRLHPLLGHLLSSGCLRLAPKFAIQDALLSHCNGALRQDVYCNNIYVL